MGDGTANLGHGSIAQWGVSKHVCSVLIADPAVGLKCAVSSPRALHGAGFALGIIIGLLRTA